MNVYILISKRFIFPAYTKYAMVESIEWTKLAPTYVIEEKKGSFWVTGLRAFDEGETVPVQPEFIVTWGSRDAAVAQSYLSAVVGHAKKMDLRPKIRS